MCGQICLSLGSSNDILHLANQTFVVWTTQQTHENWIKWNAIFSFLAKTKEDVIVCWGEVDGKLCNTPREEILLLDSGCELWAAAFLAAFHVCQCWGSEPSADSHGQPGMGMFPGGWQGRIWDGWPVALLWLSCWEGWPEWSNSIQWVWSVSEGTPLQMSSS